MERPVSSRSTPDENGARHFQRCFNGEDRSGLDRPPLQAILRQDGLTFG